MSIPTASVGELGAARCDDQRPDLRGRADDEDLPDETVYPGHALTDPTAGQRSDRFYFINFPAGDGLSAGVECAAVLGNGRRV